MIEGKVTGDDVVIARVAGMSPIFRAALVESVKRQWYRVQAKVVTDKLSGDPLHRVTGVLASSINVGGPQTASEFTETAERIVARIGTRVRYGFVHEHGGIFQIPGYTRSGGVSVRSHIARFPQRAFLRPTIREERSAVLSAIREDMARAAAQAKG
jgi:phage gpG-like protein